MTMNTNEISGKRQMEFLAGFDYIREAGTAGEEKAAALQKQLDALKENKIKPADIDLEQKTKSDVKSESVEVKQKICQLQYNFYFDQAEFNVDKPYLLVIKDAYCGGREFAVDPALLK